jgi:MFS family permease
MPETAAGSKADEKMSQEEMDGIAKSEGFTPEDVRHNMRALIFFDSAWQVNLTDVGFVMQPLLIFLGASNALLGYAAGPYLTALLPLILSPFITRRFRFKKYYLFTVVTIYLVPLLLNGLGVLLNRKFAISRPHLLIWVMGMWVAQQFFNALVALPSQEFISACIPTTHRGRLFGWSLSIGGIGGMGITALGGWMLLRYPKPEVFGALLIMAWMIGQAAYVVTLAARERPTPIEKSPPPWSLTMFKAAWSDKPFLRGLGLYAMMVLFISPTAVFMNAYGLKGLKMVAAYSALFMMLNQAARAIASAPSGHIADKFSPRMVFPYSFSAVAFGLLPAIILQNKTGVIISVAILAIAGSFSWPAWTTLLYSLPKPENRAGHFSVQLLLAATLIPLGNVMAGHLCDIMPYRTVFIIYSILALAVAGISVRLLGGGSGAPNQGRHEASEHR